MGEQLPDSWANVSLGRIAEKITKGSTPTTYGYEFQSEGINFIKIENVRNGKIDLKSITDFISDEANNNQKRSQLNTADILFSIAGTIGEIAIVEDKHLPANTNQAFAIISGFSEVLEPKFLEYQLKSFVTVATKNRARGGAMNNVSLGDLKELNAVVAPLNEQKRIVAKIEELFSELDKGIESLKTAQEQLKVYRQAVLKHAFEGKLTTQWREEKFIPIEKWEYVCIEDVADVGTGATPKRGEKKYYKNGVYPWITSGALNNDYVNESNECITTTALRETNCKLYQPGTILVAMYGEGKTRGKASVLKIEAATNQACAAITINKDNVLRDYLWNFFKFNYENIRLRSSGGVQPNLNLGHIRKIKFPLPSLEEQEVINCEIGSQLSKMQFLYEQIDVNIQISEALRQAILKKAFSGQLVDQNPSDEPASVLLERIKAEKSGKNKESRKTKTTKRVA